MDHLRQIALAYYLAGGEDVQTEAQNFFQTLDGNNDSHVNKHEFISFMSAHYGHRRISSQSFFHDLDIDGNGTLDFLDVITLLYVVKSGRPFCDHCEKFIPSAYFTCVDCDNNAAHNTEFNLCISCYENKKWSGHNHHGRPAHFFALIRAKKSCAGGSSNNTTNINIVSHGSTSVYVGSAPATPTATAIAPPPNKFSKWKIALEALEVTLGMAYLAQCTIM